MHEQFASVTVTVTQGGATLVYEVPKVVDFKTDSEWMEEPPFSDRDRVRLRPPRRLRSIAFSMRPLPDDGGMYATVHTAPTEEKD